MKKKKYTDQQIISIAAQVTSCAELIKRLNLKPAGGNYSTMKKNLAQLNIDCSHWAGQGWNKSKKLKDWENYKKTKNLKPHLIKRLGHKCQNCGASDWCGRPIPLEVHHIDGDRVNNSIENLQLLCPNCHACTDNWRGRKTKQALQPSC